MRQKLPVVSLLVALLALACCNDKPPLPERTLDLKVYPNPTIGPVKIAANMANYNAKTLVIYDPEGKQIAEKTLEPQFVGPNLYTHDLSGELPGYYTFVLKSENPTLVTKVLKQ